MTMGLPCDRDGYDLRIPPCPKCGSRGCPDREHRGDIRKSAIIEESESCPGLHRMATVRSDRGDEYVINTDAAIKALAQLFSDFDNEKRFGWNLNSPWFEAEIRKLRTLATSP